MKQRSEEWYLARLGKVTASRISDIIEKNKNGLEKAGRKNYRTELLCERLTGANTEGFTNSAMQWGIDHEDEARSLYEITTGNEVEEIGFIDHKTINMSGASPDGLIGNDGLIEIKCPNTSTHLEYLLKDEVPSEYINQMQWQLECTGRKWCDFVSFDPRLPVELKLFVKRYDYNDELSKTITNEVMLFLAELDSLENKLRERM